MILQRRQEGLVCSGRSGWPQGSCIWLLVPSPFPSGSQGTHQAARQRKCRRAKLTPEHSTIAGTFWAETIFATCHTLSLCTLPGSQDVLGTVRGEGRVAPRRAHPRPRSLARAPPAQPRWACVCTRTREAGPAFLPPPSLLGVPCGCGAVQTAPHPFVPVPSRFWGELGRDYDARLGKQIPTCNSSRNQNQRSQPLLPVSNAWGRLQQQCVASSLLSWLCSLPSSPNLNLTNEAPISLVV
jgi:hypothetical protein